MVYGQTIECLLQDQKEGIRYDKEHKTGRGSG